MAPELRAATFKNKMLASVASMAMVKHQLKRLGRGRRTQPGVAPAYALAVQQLETGCSTRRYRRWVTRGA